ncbi:MAG: dihydroorotase, partial [Dinoroseobacter sp.]
MTLLLLTNARLIDPEAGTDQIGSLLIRDGLIVARDPGTMPEGAEVIDCAGK